MVLQKQIEHIWENRQIIPAAKLILRIQLMRYRLRHCIPDLGGQVLLVEQMVLFRCFTVSILLKDINLQIAQNLPAVVFFSFCSMDNEQITMKFRCHIATWCISLSRFVGGPNQNQITSFYQLPRVLEMTVLAFGSLWKPDATSGHFKWLKGRTK